MARAKPASVQTETSAPEADLLAAYPIEFLECRVDRHRWGKVIWSLVAANVSERAQMCERCGMRRVQQVNTKTWGRVGSMRYQEPPQGYYTRHSGLILDDFRRRLFEGDFTRAAKEGRVNKG